MEWNWDHLRFFLALAERGTLTHAGRSLGVSHTTVLRRVRAFEAALGVRLFERAPSGYRLSEAGRELFHSVSAMRQTLDAVARDISGSAQEVRGEVVITAPDTIGTWLLPPIVRRLQEHHPRLHLHVQIDNGLVDLRNREADVAIRTGGDVPDSLIGKRLGSVAFVACATHAYCDATGLVGLATDLSEHRFIELGETFRTAHFSRWLSTRIPSAASRMRVDSFLDAYAFCRAGCGITVLPRYLVQSDESLRALDGGEEIPRNEVWLLSHADLRDLARLRTVRDALASGLEPHFAPADVHG